MFALVSQYESIAKEEACRLAQTLTHTVEHGSDGFCPNCGQPRIYDLKGLGVSAASIFFSNIGGAAAACVINIFRRR